MIRGSALLLLLLCSCAKNGPAGTPPRPPPVRDDPVISTLQPEFPAERDAPSSQPGGGETLVAFFDRDKAEISPRVAAVLNEAARRYLTTGHSTVSLAAFLDESGPEAMNAELWQDRVDAARAHLENQGFWCRAVMAGPDGKWLSWSSASSAGPDGPILLLGPPPAALLPMPSPPPPSKPRGDRPPPLVRVASANPLPRAGMAHSLAGISAEKAWLTPTGTLRAKVLEAMLQECIRLEGELSAECQALVNAGAGEFRRAPLNARNEFNLLIRSCRGADRGEKCVAKARVEREFRAFPRGLLKPSPLKMIEDEETLFTAFIIDDPSRVGAGSPGDPIGVPVRVEGAQAGGETVTVIPFSEHMCFRLTASHARDFLIKPRSKPCMDRSPTGGRIAFQPQWDVTPLRPGRLELLLVTELFVNSEKREYPHDQYPLYIEVTPKPSLWDKIDHWITRATETVKRTTALAVAIGALFAAIAAWGIWSYLKRRKGSRKAKKKE